MMAAFLEDKNITATSQGDTIIQDDVAFDMRFGWQGFFEWVHRGTFTIPELPDTAAGTYPSNSSDYIQNVEDRILQAYDNAKRQNLVDFENKVMDVLYDVGYLMREPLNPHSMRDILSRIQVDSKMQTYCALTIALVLSSRDYWDPATVDAYADLAADIPELLRDVFHFRGVISRYSRWRFMIQTPLVHNVLGYCAFHEHPNGEECYLQDGSRPLYDWEEDEGEDEDDESESETSDSEAEMEDKGPQTEELAPEYSDAQTQADMDFGEEDYETEEDSLGEEESEDMGVSTLDVADTEDETPRVANKRKECPSTENEKKYMLHNC